ncbi:MAG: S49 family peptidase, partial [Calditrichaeota bacterium]|nr:S49 family peptidase [Calditrichota bacterium]
MKTCLKCLLIVCVILAVLFILFISLITSAFTETIIIADHSTLEIYMNGPLQEYQPDDELSDLLNVQPRFTTMHDLRRGLAAASEDDRIDAVTIYLGAELSFSQMLEIRSLIEHFRDSGKPVYAYLEFVGNTDYLLAKSCTQVFMAPEGQLYLNKLQASVIFLKETLAKAGIEADFLHVGKYKSAPEQLTRPKMSPASQEQFQELLYHNQSLQDSLLRLALGEIDLDQLYKQAVFDGETALNAGLVDSIIYEDQLQEMISGNYRSYEQISLNKYLDAIDEDGSGKRIAVIYVTGTLMPGGDGDDPVLGSISGASRIIANIRSAARSSSVSGIILRIDSPGGASLAADMIYREILLAKRKKPVIASVSSLAASGGYYVAMACDSIIATPSSILGSIGVFMGKYNLSKLKEDILSIKTDRILPKDKSDINLYNTDRNFTDAEKRILQDNLDRFYQRFIAKVAETRRMPLADVEAVAQ